MDAKENKKGLLHSKKNKMKRVEFCKKMIEKNISGRNILFTDEAIIDMECYIRDSIRLSDENKIKLKNGEKKKPLNW